MFFGSCTSCRFAPAGAIEADAVKVQLTERRAADIAGLAIAGYEPLYWTAAEYARMRRDYAGASPRVLQALLPKPYADEYAEATQRRVEEEMRTYKRNYARSRAKEKQNEG